MEHDGQIFLEAEHATTSHGWKILPGKSGQAMQDDAERGTGWLSFDVHFSQPGRYFVHLLCLAPERNTSKNDCYVLLNEEQLHAVGDDNLRPDGVRVHSEKFVWSSLPKGPGAHTPDAIRNNQVYFEVQDTGWHDLKIVSRSKGFTVDKIALLKDQPDSPSGLGANETLFTSDLPLARVGQWAAFEKTFQSPRNYANPFESVQLNATFFAPDGETVTLQGFYDGENSWQVRFMPDQQGIWEYSVASSDSSMVVEGQFECVASDIPGLISTYDKNPIWFGFKKGGPVILRSLHIGDRFFANQNNPETDEQWSDALRTEFLDWTQEQGYNMLSIASHLLNRQQESRGQGWNTPDLWDEEKQQPNPAEYQRMEAILDDLRDRGIIVYPFAGFFGRGSDFPKEETAQDLYIEYTLARLGSYWNLLYMVGGPEPLLPKYPYFTKGEVDKIARKIKAADVYGHLLSTHNRTGDDEYMEYPWNDYAILQGPKTIDRQKLSREALKNHHPDRPLYLQETLWPGNMYGHPDYTLDDIRKNAFVMLLSAGMINFGDMSGNSSSGFSGKIDFDKKVQARHDAIKRVWDFFETFPYHAMRPRQDVVDTGYCLAEAGKQYLVYLEKREPIHVQLLPGKYTFEWINAQDFTDREPGHTLSESATLLPPERGDDWLLFIQRV